MPDLEPYQTTREPFVNEKGRNTYRVRVGCPCGRTVLCLTDPEVCECGRYWNFVGQELTDPSMWEE